MATTCIYPLIKTKAEIYFFDNILNNKTQLLDSGDPKI